MIAQATTEIDWRSVGVIGAIVVAILVLGIRRVWLFTWVHDRIVAGKDREIALLSDQLERERLSAEEWKDLSLRQAGVVERTVERTTEIVRKAAKTVAGDAED